MQKIVSMHKNNDFDHGGDHCPDSPKKLEDEDFEALLCKDPCPTQKELGESL